MGASSLLPSTAATAAVASVRAPSGLRAYAPILIVTALFVLAFFLMMRRLGGAGSPMAFGRSRGKMYAQEDIGVTFDDVAGIDEAVEELRLHLAHPEFP